MDFHLATAGCTSPVAEELVELVIVADSQREVARLQRVLLGLGRPLRRQLEELNFSHNRVGCFKEILNLARLRMLRSLCFSDPHFGENPV